MTHKSIGTLLFDLDGTLVDSVADLAGSLDVLMAEKGLPPIGVDTGRELIGHGIANLVRSALKLRGASGSETDVAHDIARFMEIYGARLTELTRPYPNVMQTLDILQEQGWRMGVCTNKRARFAQTIVSNLGMDTYFGVVSGPDTFGVGKPDPQQLWKTAEAVGGGHPCVFVGDFEVDVAAAKAAKFPIIALSYGYSKTPLISLSPEALIDRFEQVPQAIAQILRAID